MLFSWRGGRGAAANIDEFTTWTDFKNKFKEKYWSENIQGKLKFELSDPIPYDKRQGTIK